jgi:transposase
MIRPDKSCERIFIYRKPVDFRKQVNGLSALIQFTLKHNPLSGDLFVFFNRVANKIRILYWEHNGFVLYGQYLEKDTFSLPSAQDDQIQVTGEQLNWLLNGINIDLIMPHKPLKYALAG